MSFQNRKQKILSILDQKGEAEVKELAESLSISEITIRRDLQQLAADGLLYRTHGGAMKLSLTLPPVTFAQKSAVRAEQKDRICRRAAQEIRDGEVIFMDCGSTVFRLCAFIKHKRIKVITNSLPVVHELLHTEVSVNLIGGEVDKDRQAVHGRMAQEHISRYKAHRAFVGADGISPAGLTAFSEKEAEITLAMAAQAAQTYLLCDASKLGKEAYLVFAGLETIHTLITDATPAQGEAYEEKGLRIFYA